jgi:hypothetical protein
MVRILPNTTRPIGIACCVAVLLFFSVAAHAQLESQLSAYTGRNASGYLAPLVGAFGADMNAGLFHTARIPRGGFHLGLEFRVMSVFFTDGDPTFLAVTEGDFLPETTAEAPTVVGSKKAVIVEGQGGTKFAFPGGLDLNSFSMAAPQLRIGSLYGTEALIRYSMFNTGKTELGRLIAYGFGFRHSITQHFGQNMPVDMALFFFWQRLSLGKNERGDNLVAARALAAGLHVSKKIVHLEPYLGISYEGFSIDAHYYNGVEGDTIDLSFDSGDDIYLTLGFSFNAAFMSASGEYNFGDQDALSFGIAFHYH